MSMFPVIIDLRKQVNVLNTYLVKHQIPPKETLILLSLFGTVVAPDKESSFRYGRPLLGLGVEATIRVNAYIHRSNYGIFSVFKFVEPHFQIMVSRSLNDFWFEVGYKVS